MRYIIHTFKNADSTYLVFELLRFSPRSRGGTCVASKAIHRGQPLALFRQARFDLKSEMQARIESARQVTRVYPANVIAFDAAFDADRRTKEQAK